MKERLDSLVAGMYILDLQVKALINPVLKLNIKCLTDDIRLLYENHGTSHVGDSGLDLFVPEKTVIKANSISNKIKLGIACEAFLNDKPSSFFLFPRSSIVKTPLRLANSIGLIDASYRGELMAVVDNLSNEDYLIEKGDRLFQLVAPNTCPIKFTIKEQLSQTTRGDGGFGSTGK